MQTIVTHPGSAHKDDFIAVCVLLTLLPGAWVERREPSPDDLQDRDTFVVDVGMEFDPARHNFDHHQDPNLPCAFHLVMQHLGYHQAASQVFSWYQHMSMMDVRGPYRTAEDLGVDSHLLFAAASPIDGFILGRFAGLTRLLPGDPFYEMMREFGSDLLSMIAHKKERLERLKEEARIYPVKHLKALVSPIADDPKLAMELYLRELDDRSVVMSITPSARGAGWELLRLGDNRIVDFRALTSSREIRFIHGNGFVAKTTQLFPVDQVLELAAAAISEPKTAQQLG